MSSNNSQRAVAWWLFACCAMVFVTMVVGGVTRLTHSGLSIVEWKPLIGALPPLSHADWLELFAKYQQTPEFIKRNHDMTLDGFQFIFWWEWAHRLSGRLIGVVFFVPYVWFLLRGKLRGALAAKVFGFFILGGLQGAMGWYMVQSGLVDDPRVSQYRLAAHLGLAFLLFGLMFWTGLGMLQARQAKVGAGDTAASACTWRKAPPGNTCKLAGGAGTVPAKAMQSSQAGVPDPSDPSGVSSPPAASACPAGSPASAWTCRSPACCVASNISASRKCLRMRIASKPDGAPAQPRAAPVACGEQPAQRPRTS